MYIINDKNYVYYENPSSCGVFHLANMVEAREEKQEDGQILVEIVLRGDRVHYLCDSLENVYQNLFVEFVQREKKKKELLKKAKNHVQSK